MPTLSISTNGWHYIGWEYSWGSSSNYYIGIYVDGQWALMGSGQAPNQMRAPSGNLEIGRSNAGSYYLQGGLGVFFMAGSIKEYVEEFYQVTKGNFGF